MEARISKEQSLELLGRVEDLKLHEYYSFNEDEFVANQVRGSGELKKLLEEPKFLKYNGERDAFTYKDSDGSEKVLDEVVGLNDFTQTNLDISKHLIDVSQLFINESIGDVSKEQECFYLCLNIAGVFGGKFKDSFVRILDVYDFDEWSGKENIFGEVENFDNLYKEFQKVSTIKMRMLCSACSFKIKSEKNVGFSFQQSGLSQG